MSGETNNTINSLKDELLQEIRLLENKMNSKFDEQTVEIKNFNIMYSSKYEEIYNNNKNILENFVDQKVKLDKIDEIEKFKNKVDNMLLTHEIRINNSIEDLNKAKTKYDKILAENLTIPSFVGPNCQYKTISDCIIFTINDSQKMKSENNHIRKELKETKNKIDSLMSTTLSLVNSSITRCNSYAIENLQNLNKNMQKNLDDINTKIENLENNFNEHKEITGKDFKKLYNEDIENKDNIKKMKINFTEIINEENKKNIKLKEYLNEKINFFNEQINIIRSIVNQCYIKSTNFDNIIKDIRGRYCKMYNDVYRNKKLMSQDSISLESTNKIRAKRNSISYDRRKIRMPSSIIIELDDNNKKEENKKEKTEEKKEEIKIITNIKKKIPLNILRKKIDKNNIQLYNNFKKRNEKNNLYNNFDKEKDSVDTQYMNSNSKFDKENKFLKCELSNDNNTNSPKMINLSRNTENIIDSYSSDKKNYENVYKLVSLGYEKNMKYNYVETYSLAAKKSNKKRIVNIENETPLSTRLTSLHIRNNSNVIFNGNSKDTPCKIGSVFGRTAYTFYNKKEEKYNNLISINKNIKKNKSLNENVFDYSLIPVAKIKIKG